MNLYMVTTRAGWLFYAIADNETSAKALVDEILNRKSLGGNGYGFDHERVVVKIEKLAQTYHDVETRRTYLPQLLKAQEEK
jgi:hypothetical protein